MVKRENTQETSSTGAMQAMQEEEGVAVVQEQISDVYNMGTIEQAELTEKR